MDAALESPAPPATVLAIDGISKQFGGRPALEEVTLDVKAGEVHCLLGENGAGKSTLCNIVFGVHRPDAGHLRLGGQRFLPVGPAHALASGVAMVHQHFSLVGNMTALENMLLGRARGRSLALADMAKRVRHLSEEYGLEVNLERPVEDLSVGERQRVEVLRCLLDGPQLLVLDEPTAVLPPREVGALLEICRRLAARGCGLVLVTHKLAEIAEIAHRTTVLRRGRVVETVTMAGAGTDLRALVRAMVGREVKPLEIARATPQIAAVEARASADQKEDEALRLDGLVVKDGAGATRLDLSLTVRRGEIVGVAGVEGNGQSQLGAVLAGLLAPSAGKVLVGGADVTGKPPRELSRLGVGIVPEDRHAVGCHLPLSVAENLLLGDLSAYTRFGLLRRDRMAATAMARMEANDIRAAGPDAPMSSLSGGNQQKVVLARELALDPLVFLLAAQPTRGLDVGAVEAVYTEIRKACDRGAGVLLVSSELDELLAVADRVLVIYRGRIVGELPAHPQHKDAVGTLMSGQVAAVAA
ncbi:MAG TPA: ABC transporter ATP-binding protein [Polyangia bacterium]|nr:ABC transporter ATP-binding protein [Polyangia bacterium]